MVSTNMALKIENRWMYSIINLNFMTIIFSKRIQNVEFGHCTL